MYTSPNFPSKAALRRAVAGGQKVTVFQPNNLTGQQPPSEGKVSVEGPHYPQAHSWYGQVTLRGGYVVKVI